MRLNLLGSRVQLTAVSNVRPVVSVAKPVVSGDARFALLTRGLGGMRRSA